MRDNHLSYTRRAPYGVGQKGWCQAIRGEFVEDRNGGEFGVMTMMFGAPDLVFGRVRCPSRKIQTVAELRVWK